MPSEPTSFSSRPVPRAPDATTAAAGTAASLGDPGRLRALKATGILLDTARGHAAHACSDPDHEAGKGIAGAPLDRLAALAARVLGARTALVSVIDADRQVFAGCWGLDEPWDTTRETPLSHSFCQHVVTTAAPLVIEDARAHSLVADNLAIRDLGIVAYAGMPLVADDGHVLGSLCVTDSAPRRWTDAELATLADLASGASAELALRAATRRLAARESELGDLLDHTDELACRTDANGHLTFVNAAWRRALGYTTAEAAGVRLLDLVAREDRGRAIAVVHRLLGGEAVHAFEAVLVAKDGQGVACRGWAIPQMTTAPDGRVTCVGIRAGYRDVTLERREGAARAQLAATLDASPDLVALLESDGRLTYVNRAGRHLIGLAEDADLRALVLDDLYPEAEQGRLHDEALPIARRTGTWAGESVLVGAGGTPVPVSIALVAHATTTAAGDTAAPAPLMSVVARDLRDRVRTEATLRESEGRFRAALDAALDAFYVLDAVREGAAGSGAAAMNADVPVADFSYVEANARGAAALGLEREDLIGQRLLGLFPIARTSGAFQRFVDVVTAGEPWEGEHQSRDPRETAAWQWMQIVPLRSRGLDGPVTGVAVTVRDITARKRADGEAQLLLDVTRALAAAPDADGAFRAALAAMCAATGLPYAEAWVPDPVDGSAGDLPGLRDGAVLVRASTWFADGDARLAAYADASGAIGVGPGEGLPGTAVSTGAPVWIADVTAPRLGFPHAALARRAGLRGGLAVPVHADGPIVAVLAFHSRQSETFGAAELALLTAVAAQVGAVVRQKLAKAALVRERAFLAATLESLSDGVVACDAAGRLVLFNRATQLFHGLPPESPLSPQDWAAHYSLFRADGVTPLPLDEIPLRRAFSGEDVRDAEFVIAPSHGPARRIRANGRPIRAGDGTMLGAVAAMRDVTETVRAETALREREADLRLTQDAAGMRGWTLDFRTGELVLAPGTHDVVDLRMASRSDETAIRWAEGEPESITAAVARARIHPDDIARADADLAAALADADGRYASTYRAPGLDGAWRWVRATGRVEHAPDGAPLRLRGVTIDVTDERELRRRAEVAEAELRALFAAMRDVVFVLDGEGMYRRVIPTAPDLLYRPAKELEGRRMHDVLPAAAADAFVAVLQRVLATGAAEQHEYGLDRTNGHTEFAATVSPVGDGTVLWVARDVTAQKRAEASLLELSTRDELTGIYNRRGFRPLAEQSQALGRRSTRRDAVLYVDLDRFKMINDTYGHAAGDEALQMIACVLRDTVREGDLVARLGGDEFVVYAAGLGKPGEGHVLAARLAAACDAANARATADGRAWTVGFSIGVAETVAGDTIDTLMARADAALYAEKLARPSRTAHAL